MGLVSVTGQRTPGVKVYSESDLVIADKQWLQLPAGVCYGDVRELFLILNVEGRTTEDYFKRSDGAWVSHSSGYEDTSETSISATATKLRIAWSQYIHYARLILK